MTVANQLQDTALRYFLEVVQCGSVSLASQRLHVAMSAISRQIASLEAQLGAPLFERHARGMVPTAAGEILAQHARRISLEATQAVEAIQALATLGAGGVRIATSDAFANELVPSVCAQFQQDYPGVRFEVLMCPTAQVSGRLLSGDADIGLCFSLAPVKDIHVVHRQNAPVVAILPPDHPLARRRRVSLAELTRYPLALPPAETAVRQVVDMACARQELALDPVLVSNHAQTLLKYVQYSGGVSVSSEVSVRHLVASGELIARPISDAGMDLRDIEVQTLAGRTLQPAAKAWLELLVQRLEHGD
ncbi:LysR family transcriptional regulator [Diaphorobacter aerolatus]|uniref:LysR family transcriptional regulator n=1 Tax=Diaphorobacter aerolatus TaxID=1288495 RepID=A0A7H0GPC0_9BURK|nr:LysR family transcriptional regulator [Diaphorobacter aerolatus]QNP50136.1 LysR family transcriptional regulator [Diaphorobacter aerolatus]